VRQAKKKGGKREKGKGKRKKGKGKRKKEKGKRKKEKGKRKKEKGKGKGKCRTCNLNHQTRKCDETDSTYQCSFFQLECRQ
jgi:hypothetical protein